MRAHLDAADATFDFLVQFQSDSTRAPIEDATVEWTEQDCPVPPRGADPDPAPGLRGCRSNGRCEQTGFNPWHCLADHRPLGSMNRARREIYTAMAAFRAARR